MPIPRLQLFELDDQSWFPTVIRDLSTDYIHFIEITFRLHRPVVPLLAAALRTTQSERIIVFPMAVVPNLWGVWNILFMALHTRRNVPIGLHGAALPFLLAPLAFTITRILDFPIPHFVAAIFPIAFPVGLIVYYLAWKYLVSFLNRALELA